jgi:hypothetical protein
MDREKTQAEPEKPQEYTARNTCLWVDTAQKIASFHEFPEGERVEFREESFFSVFVEGLVATQYRFQ